jgi:hypothetical protein
MTDNLSYEEKIKHVFSIIPQTDFHNYKWREKIQLERLGLSNSWGHRIHGPDSNEFSLKSSTLKINKGGKYKVNLSTPIGTFGRVDKDMTYDKKNTCCSLFSCDGLLLLSVTIYYDDNFETMYSNEQSLKRDKMSNNKQTRDSVLINFNLIKKYNLTYDISYKSDNIILPSDILK